MVEPPDQGYSCAPSVTPYESEDDYKPLDSHKMEGLSVFQREILKDLRNPKETFDGSRPERFQRWRTALCRDLRALNCDPCMTLKLLEANTDGGALDIVKGLQGTNDSPASCLRQIWRWLRQRFGNSTLVAHVLTKDITETKRFPDYDRDEPEYAENIRGMEKFLWLCREVRSKLDEHPDLGQFNLRPGMNIIVSKMPPEFVEDWEKHVWQLVHRPPYGHQSRFPTINDLLISMEDFISRKADPYFFPGGAVQEAKCFSTRAQLVRSKSRKNVSQESAPSDSSSGTTSDGSCSEDSVSGDDHPANECVADAKSSSGLKPLMAVKVKADTPYCFFHLNHGHGLSECTSYHEQPVKLRLQLVKEHHLCYRCLGQHLRRNCTARTVCDRCDLGHHPSLHGAPFVSEARSTKRALRTCGTGVSTPRMRTCSKTVPVLIRSRNDSKTISTVYCIIDEKRKA